MKKELKTLRSKNPKEYWKILNKGQKKKQPNISIDVLYEFFKNLNGALPELKIRLNRSTYNAKNISGVDFMNSFLIISSPDALSFLSKNPKEY
jgi:hypothetical protein